MIQVALLFWSVDQGKEFFRVAREVCASLPPDVNVIIGGINAPPAPFVPAEHQGKPGYVAVIAGFGEEAQHVGGRRPFPCGAASVVGVRHTHAVRGSADDVRRGECLGAVRL